MAAAASFPGYPKRGITFLRQIVTHNNRDWFQEKKAIYEEDVRGATADLVEALNAKLKGFAPDYLADPKKAIMRIYRDTRFSKNKDPYKTNVSALFTHHGCKRGNSAGFYLSVSAGGVDVVAGAYELPTPLLTAVRTAIAEDPKTLPRLAGRKGVKDGFGALQGEQLKRVPRGFDAEHPAADLLRNKQFYVHTQLPLKLATTPQLYPEIVKRFKAATPFVAWLDEAMA